MRLNAANARWVSLYDSLYGTDVIPETKGALRGKTYNPLRGERVIYYVRNFLDKFVPLEDKSWKDLKKIPKVNNNKLDLNLKILNNLLDIQKNPNSYLLFYL